MLSGTNCINLSLWRPAGWMPGTQRITSSRREQLWALMSSRADQNDYIIQHGKGHLAVPKRMLQSQFEKYVDKLVSVSVIGLRVGFALFVVQQSFRATKRTKSNNCPNRWGQTQRHVTKVSWQKLASLPRAQHVKQATECRHIFSLSGLVVPYCSFLRDN